MAMIRATSEFKPDDLDRSLEYLETLYQNTDARFASLYAENPALQLEAQKRAQRHVADVYEALDERSEGYPANPVPESAFTKLFLRLGISRAH